MAKKKKNTSKKNQPKPQSSYKARQARNMRIIVVVVSVILVLSMVLSSISF